MRTFVGILSFLGATLMAGEEPPLAVTKETAASFYRSYQRLTKQPRDVSPQLSILCAGPSPELLARERMAKGPHFGAMIHIYANAPAADTIARKLETYPAGSVIVKEKLGEKGAVTGVGGMIKRAPGFDALHGDWEYFYSDLGDNFATGRLANCIDCHAGAKSTDYVFSRWKTFSER